MKHFDKIFGGAFSKAMNKLDEVFDSKAASSSSASYTTIRITLTDEHVAKLLTEKSLTFRVADTTIRLEKN